MGHVYTSRGEVTIKHERFKEDLAPLDPDCGCPVCRRHSRAYLRNLFVLKDFSAPMLLSMHNVYFYLAWMRKSATRSPKAAWAGSSRRRRRSSRREPEPGFLPLGRRRGYHHTASESRLEVPDLEVPLTPLEFARRTRRLHPIARPSSTAPGASPIASSSSVATASRRAAERSAWARRPRRDDREQLARAPRAVLRGAADRRGARPDQLPPDGRRLRLHPGAQRRARRLRARRRDRRVSWTVRAKSAGPRALRLAFDGPPEGWLDYEAELQRTPARCVRAAPPIDERDLLSINYTSGTTARPKGVMITHRNAWTNVDRHARSTIP